MVSIIPHPLSVWHHRHYTCDIVLSTHAITTTVYDVISLYIYHHPQYIYDIISSMYAITILLSWQHNKYSWHLTQYIWDHSHCICVITQMVNTSVLMYCSIDDIHQVCKSSQLAPVWYHTQSHHITFTIYDINDHVLWHHKHCIHDFRTPLYDITSTL